MLFDEKMLRLLARPVNSTPEVPMRDFNTLHAHEKVKVVEGCEDLSVEKVAESRKEYEKRINDLYSIFIHTIIRYDIENNILEEEELNCHPIAYNYDSHAGEKSKILKEKMRIKDFIAAGEYEIIIEKFKKLAAELEIECNKIDRIIKFIESHETDSARIDLLLAEREKLSELFTSVHQKLKEVSKRIKKTIKSDSMENALSELLKQLKENKNKENRKVFMKALADMAHQPKFRTIWDNSFKDELNGSILLRISKLETPFSMRLKELMSSISESEIDDMLQEIDIYDKCGRSDHTDPKLELRKRELLITFITKHNIKEAWEYLVSELPNTLLLELFKLLAKFFHNDEENAYGKRNDYEEPLREAEAVIEEIKNDPNRDGIALRVYGPMLNFGYEMYHYGEKCYNYITPQWREKIAKTYAMLNWIHSGYCDYYLYSDFNMGPDPALYDLTSKNNKTTLSKKEASKFVNEFKKDIWDAIKEKFGFQFRDLGTDKIENSDYRILTSILASGKIPRVFVHPTKDNPLGYINNGVYKVFYLDDDKDITFNQIYAHLRSINSGDITFNFKRHKMPEFDKALALMQSRILDENYDDRILIVSSLTENPVGMINSNPRFKAVYFDDSSKISELINAPCSPSCIFIPERFISPTQCDDSSVLPSGTSVIVVRNDVTYSELSDMLNQKIASMEDAKRNVYTEE